MAALTAWSSGSSPLTRGKPDQRRGHAFGAGLIPAHAGKTACAVPGTSWPRAHPRSRGENRVTVWVPLGDLGSSPLTRGKPCHQARRLPARGLIPAHAGKTGRSGAPEAAPRAHPRSRGENGSHRRGTVKPKGSSPLTRGKQLSGDPGDRSTGLIPAHAGKTDVLNDRHQAGWAHPRSRGENPPRGHREEHDRGSSPLTRGKPSGARCPYTSTGLIPAHAGKTTHG